LVADKPPQPMGNDNVTASPSGTFATADGLINIAANKQEQFEAICHLLERPEWLTDARFAQRQARLENRQALSDCIEAALKRETTEYWWPRLVEAGVPAGPVYSVAEALAHPQVRDRGLIERFGNDTIGRPLEVVSGGYRFDGEAPRVASPPPRLGQDNDILLPTRAANDE
ncbi:MAG: CoA transferase, partial [Salinicola sp.]